MNRGQRPPEIAADLTQLQYKSLEALRRLGGEAYTSEITASTEDLYGQLLHQHYNKMMPAGMVERTEEAGVSEDGQLDPKGHKYRITDRGRDVLTAAEEDFGSAPAEEHMIRARLSEADERLNAVERRLNAIEEALPGVGAGGGTGSGGGTETGAGTVAAVESEASTERVESLEEELQDLRESHEALIEDAQGLADEVVKLKQALDDEAA